MVNSLLKYRQTKINTTIDNTLHNSLMLVAKKLGVERKQVLVAYLNDLVQDDAKCDSFIESFKIWSSSKKAVNFSLPLPCKLAALMSQSGYSKSSLISYIIRRIVTDKLL